MCSKNASNPAPAPTPVQIYSQTAQSSQDVHSEWLNNLITNLAQKVNTNINIRQLGNGSIIMSNISEFNLPQLPFLTNTDSNNNYGRVTGFGVSIPGQNSANPLKVPGLSEAIVKAYNDSDSQAFINGNKTHKPFVTPFKNPTTGAPMTVGQYVDMQTASNPSLPNTTSICKTYSVAFDPKKRNGNRPMAGSFWTYLENLSGP